MRDKAPMMKTSRKITKPEEKQTDKSNKDKVNAWKILTKWMIYFHKMS